MNKRYVILTMILALTLVPALAHATARLTNVTPVAGGCVSGPTGPAVQAWDIEPGFQYVVTIEGVTECAEGGTTPNDDSTGIAVIRNDGVGFQAHLRSATFAAGCTNPIENIGAGCDVVDVEDSSWGTLKASYK